MLETYQRRAEELRTGLDVAQGQQGTAIAMLLTGLVAGAALVAAVLSRNDIPGWYPLLAVPLVVFGWRRHTQAGTEVARVARLRRFYAQGILRLEEAWAGTGVSGEEYAIADHLYAGDLHLFGEGSLFERLCTARTQIGRERLARYLQQPATLDEVRARQAAVQELAGLTDLREKVALLGGYDFLEARWDTFAEWLDSPVESFTAWYRPAAMVSCVALTLVGIAALALPTARPELQMWLLALGGLQAAAAMAVQEQVRRVIAGVAPVAAEIALIREGLELLAGQKFSAPKLAALAASATPAGPAIRRLEPWLAVLRERSKDWFYYPSMFLMLGSQSAFAVEAWRAQHRDHLAAWLENWAEFEALLSVSCYAHENMEDSWPDLLEGGGRFQAEQLGHPLLPRTTCVRNEVSLGSEFRFYIVSGSNMAGKSTLLRSIGMGAVLAYTGAPVRARAMRLSVMQLCASISIVDSLREGKSKFLAEIHRLRDTLQAAEAGPALFLIDEIFSGTNSPDRQAAAEAVIRTLAERGAIGAFSTHDIALASISAHGGENRHMASREGAESPLEFDYQLKPGVTRESNALAIARMAGVPV